MGDSTRSCAVLIASKDGEATIGDTVASAVTQADTYVVSDGSTDGTARAARAAGAEVLDLEENVGKPAAIYAAVHTLGLLDRYTYVSILDDDTIIAPDFVDRSVARFEDPKVAIVVGRTITNWTDDQRWNPWLAARAYSYWRYQVTIRPGQSTLNALNCISGSNSVYRSELLSDVLVERTPYIVDDTYWVLETQRRKLGRVVYEQDARAFIMDPTSMRDWYKQNLRWLWGTCQGIIGHRVGRHRTWFDFWYLSLILDWCLYVFAWPVLLVALLSMGWVTPHHLAAGVIAGYFLWVLAAAVALDKPRLLLFTPFIVFFDVIYRINFVHGAIKAIRQPTVESCKWDSPKRYVAAVGIETVATTDE